MKKVIFLMVAFSLSACSGLSAQPSKISDPTADLRDDSYFRSPVPRGHVRFQYENTSATPKCILAEDFQRHPSRPLFRVRDTRTEELMSYVGPLEDRPIYFTEPAYVLVRPGQTAEATFNVQENYDVSSGRSYHVSYSLAVTECHALLTDFVPVTSGSELFNPPSADPLLTWADRIAFVRKWNPAWAEVGEFVELEETLALPATE